jgi:hypothetical protein
LKIKGRKIINLFKMKKKQEMKQKEKKERNMKKLNIK